MKQNYEYFKRVSHWNQLNKSYVSLYTASNISFASALADKNISVESCPQSQQKEI